MQRVHAGDCTAFGPLMHQLRAQATVYRRWGSDSNRDDLEQELWLALWRALRIAPPRVLQSSYADQGGGANGPHAV
jgi:DNA-directed RNA polymerase specialized sigma24 family protein